MGDWVLMMVASLRWRLGKVANVAIVVVVVGITSADKRSLQCFH